MTISLEELVAEATRRALPISLGGVGTSRRPIAAPAARATRTEATAQSAMSALLGIMENTYRR